ncbi:Hypothetical predicted protein [Mytilus galloprovincialis]|uniref:Integrase catalytic domain-containing protein n=1 Tax=Mytilus galloprovincialis TaxID=29158 RepID=A0A8B6HRW3_MYTGA|nr:Hypothetical predicted protein [Mytilus galloprovincialis]
MQKYCQCSSKTPTCCNDGWKLCLVGSRFTHPAESRYAPIEGRKNIGPDAASRYPVGPPDRLNLPGEAPELDSLVNMTAHYHDTLTSLCLHTEDNDTANDASTVTAATCALNVVITVVTWSMVREATASDPTFVNLIRQLEAGFPEDHKKLPTDLYSNWPMVYKSESGAEGLVNRLRGTFVTFSIPEELTSDGGPQFPAGKTQEFLKAWGVRHRLSSVANPYANCRAEIAVKTVKHMLVDNTTAVGSLDVDKFQRALLMYRYLIDPEKKHHQHRFCLGDPFMMPFPY